MLDEGGKRSKGRNDASRPNPRSTSPKSPRIRIIGTLVGLASLLLPWGSIIVRDDIFATDSITSVGMMDLVTSSDMIVAIASFIFISATLLALIDGRAVIGLIAALICLWVTIPDLLASMAASLSIPLGWSMSTPIASGFYLGLLSAAIQAVPFLPRRREARREAQTGLIGSDRLRPEEHPYHGWSGWKGPFRR